MVVSSAIAYGVTRRHPSAWHESGHCIVALGLDCHVDQVAIWNAGGGVCYWTESKRDRLAVISEERLRACCDQIADLDPGRVHPGLAQECRQVASRDAADDPYCRIAAPVIAGAVAVAMRTNGLGLPMRFASGRLSAGDLEGYRRYQRLSRQPADPFLRACTRLAADTLERHRSAFLALVDALLEHGTLHRPEILAIWQRHAQEAA